MTILFMSDGSDSTQGLEFFSGTVGTVASSTTQSKTGPRAISILGDGSSSVTKNISSFTAGRISFWVRVPSLPSSSGAMFCFNSGATKFNLSVASDGTMDLFDGASLRASGTAVLPTAQWVHIALAFSYTSSSVNSCNVWINGVLDITATNVTWTVPPSDLFFGFFWNSVTCYVDDIYADDVSDLTFPGDIRVTAKLPVALNTNNFDTLVGSGTNRYDRVSERALSVSNGIQHAASTDVQENFGIQAASAGDVDIADAYIVGYCGWVYGKRGDFDTRLLNGSALGVVASKTAGTTTVIPTTNDMTGSGSAIVVAFSCDDNGNPGTTATCADSKGNSYAAGQSVQVAATGSGGGVRTALFVALNATALTGADTITVTHGSVTAHTASAWEFAGIATSSALDVPSSQVQSGTTAPTSNATGTLAQANEVFFGVVGVERETMGQSGARLANSFHASGMFTTGGGEASNIGHAFQYEIVNATTGKAAGFTTITSADTATVVGAYKAVTGGTSVGDPKLLVNGTETSIVLTTSNALYTSIVASQQYPTGAAAIGMRSSGTTADTYLYECGMLVAYDASKGPLVIMRKPWMNTLLRMKSCLGSLFTNCAIPPRSALQLARSRLKLALMGRSRSFGLGFRSQRS